MFTESFDLYIHESGVFVDISGLVHVRQFRRNRDETTEQIIHNEQVILTSLDAYPHKYKNICIVMKILEVYISR